MGGATIFLGGGLLGGFGGIFLLNGAIWCVLEHIFIFFLLSKSLKISFFTKIIINCSHVLARGTRSMIHSPLIIFIKGCNLYCI